VSLRSRGKVGVGTLVVVLLVLAVAGTVSYFGWRQSVPGVRVSGTPPRAIGHKSTITLVAEASGGQVSRIEVRLVQGGRSTVVAQQEGRLGRRAEVTPTLEPATAGFREGSAAIEVRARDDYWRPLRPSDRIAASLPVTIDLTPPKVEVVAATPYVAPGGAAVVVVRASADAASLALRVGNVAFPLFPTSAEGVRVGLVALPYDAPGAMPITVTARDEAGNIASRGVPAEWLPRRFPHDTIRITDAFLQAKVPELLPQYPPDKPLVDGFLIINRDQRRQAEEEKRRIAAKSADKPLWEGAFVQPRNTKVFSNFAETRTYMYQGREIDTQVHYGYDLASTKQASVPAANKGIVLFAGPLTIYGNAVIVDHGLGLMTLYGHLSSIAVKVGDEVAKGQELGQSGTTGLATGDHLHYEVLVQGISVTPVEWWDPKWIRDRIAGPLKAAGLQVAGVAPAAAEERPPHPARHRGRRAR
jgi:hypothetical protein